MKFFQTGRNQAKKKLESESIHFMLIGHSKTHVQRVVEYFKIKKMVVFISIELQKENQSFLEDLSSKGVEFLEVVPLDPFDTKALENMINVITEKYELYSNHGKLTVVTSLTGGTNLMVVAMALVASEKRLKAHYVLNNECNDVIEIDYFKKIKKKSIEQKATLVVENG
jgi:hypothetical protein